MADLEENSVTPSDAELDSEVEDADFEAEHESWMAHHSARPSFSNHKSAKVPHQEEGVVAVDFDSILSGLCDLEHQLNEQSNFDTNLAALPVSPVLPPINKLSQSPLVFKDYTNLKSTSPLHQKVPRINSALQKKDQAFLTEVSNELDFALSELSALVGTPFDAGDNSDSWSCQDSHPSCSTSDLKHPLKNNRVQCGQVTRESIASNNNIHRQSNSDGNCTRVQKGSVVAASGTGNVQNWQEHLSDGGQNDSAFDENISLPSSGSHVSMAMSSRSSGSSVTNGAMGLSNEVDEMQRCRDLHKASIEENNHSSLNKTFVRIYSPEGGSDSLFVGEQMNVSEVVDTILAKNHVKANLSWSLVEQLPNLLMERLLEDGERLSDIVLTWTKDSENRLLLIERTDKYEIFQCPERYLATADDKNRNCGEDVRRALVQEFLESNCRLPEFEGMLYIKLEGKKAWKKLYFILRASGIYYNPKGRTKTLIDLVCLQKLDLVEVYTGIGWKKKYKAPNDFGFALKHPAIQKKTPKYIKYLCAEDLTSMWCWINSIRLAKNGQQLHNNFQQRQNILCDFQSENAISRFKQTALIQEKISELFSQKPESVPSFSCASQHSLSSMQTFRSDSLDDSSSRLLKSCFEVNGKAQVNPSGTPAKMLPVIPITTQVTKQLSGQQTMRSPVKVIPKSPKKGAKETGDALLPSPHKFSNSMENCTDSNLPQPSNHEVFHGSVDQLNKTVSPAFSDKTNQNTIKIMPTANTGKWGTREKHAVIKRTPSIGHREVDDSIPLHPKPCPVSPKPLSAASTAAPVSNSLPPVRRKFPSSSSFSDCDENRIMLTPQTSPKPKPPLPPKRKDILKPSPSVDNSPTKGHISTTAGNLTLAKKPFADCRPLNALSQQNLSSPSSPTSVQLGGLTMKRSPSCESWQTPSFLTDLQRVLSQKQMCEVGFSDVAPFRNSSNVDLDSLPPPPASLLEGFKKSTRPPPPPKRSQETHLTYK